MRERYDSREGLEHRQTRSERIAGSKDGVSGLSAVVERVRFSDTRASRSDRLRKCKVARRSLRAEKGSTGERVAGPALAGKEGSGVGSLLAGVRVGGH